ncbi:MAG: hypothetical protein NC926_02780 [Candidatus Omnitrophica bacterium]|nr:hypothetical protein [Candidatus Omnitrophota bacterium]
MEKEFEKIEKGLKLLKEEKSEKDVDFVNEFARFIETKKEKETYLFWNLKLGLAFLVVTFLFLNLVFLKHKLDFEKENLVLITKKTPEIPVSVLEKKQVDERPVLVKTKKIECKKIEKEEKEIYTSNRSSLEESIIISEEINKILKLFTFNLKMEAENAEI